MDYGFIDYETDFVHPESGVSLHWCKTSSPPYRNKEEYFKYAGAINLHTHNHFEFFLITEGEVRHTLNDRTSILSKAELQFIGIGDVHGFMPFQNRSSQHINVAVTEPVLRALCNALGSDVFDTLTTSAQTTFRLSTEDYLDFFSSTQKIIASPISDVTNTTFFIKKMLIDLVAYCFGHLIVNNTAHPDWFNALIAKLYAPEYIDASASDVYRLADYSPAMTNKYFRNYTGKTVTSFLRDIKLNFACNLLEKTDQTTLAISSQLGFNSLSHFNHIFKTALGKSPQEYRRGLREAPAATQKNTTLAR